MPYTCHLTDDLLEELQDATDEAFERRGLYQPLPPRTVAPAAPHRAVQTGIEY